MSDWIDEEGAEFLRQKEYVVSMSNYLLKLRQQVEKDVEKLNTQSVWSNLLKNNPLKVVDSNGCFKVEKITIDAVYVSVKNIIEGIEISILVTGMNFKTLKKSTEKWKIGADNDSVFLTRGDKILVVPEQASKHILSPFIEVLKKEFEG